VSALALALNHGLLSVVAHVHLGVAVVAVSARVLLRVLAVLASIDRVRLELA
jgi:hypothetical protein